MRAVFFLVLMVAFSAEALTFTAEEIQTHQERIELITDTASKCLDSTYREHLDFYSKYGVSKFYGDRRKDYQSDAGRRAALAAYGYSPQQVKEIADQLRPMSCIGLTLRCLGQGFAAAGQSATWNKIYADLKIDDKLYGTDLQKHLRGLGWKILLWNPDPSKNAVWDEEDRRINPLKPGKSWNPVWGGHAARYREVTNKGSYYSISVDDAQSLVGFGDVQPTAFTRINFFVGTAHSGYHVFPGRNGEVIEAHSMRELKSRDNLEYSEFNPLKSGGGPRWTASERYRSGIVAIPPSR